MYSARASDGQTLSLQEVFERCRSGVAQIILEKDRERVTAGSAFLISGGLVTNSHVIRDADFEVAAVLFEGMGYEDAIRLTREACVAAVGYESLRDEDDVAFLQLSEPEFAGRHIFQFGKSASLRVGDGIGFLGYPFEMQRLTCHVGYVSSLYVHGNTNVIQIDGSVNGGNSGGPMIELSGGCVVGIVSRAEVGFLADQFDALIRSLNGNVETLRTPRNGAFYIMGIDPLQGLLASQSAMLQIARNLRRSANVGIGYAFGTDHLRDSISSL